MIDIGFNMLDMRPLRIDFQMQNVGRNSGADGFPRKTWVSKRGDWPFSCDPVMDSTKMGEGRIEKFP
jgi:hypothetical protein